MTNHHVDQEHATDIKKQVTVKGDCLSIRFVFRRSHQNVTVAVVHMLIGRFKDVLASDGYA
ncbi:hypothetical protein [Vibrio rotiferianus]|uniref:hypothetical protein n=1 Tax=Vibrio rotiferianus TaxID=190895 RepID=UPI0014867CDB|nr:hypothetical protein [Vibrio rotiferianus]